MKRTILFLEQQSWLGGAQRVLETVIKGLDEGFRPLVAFPDDGPFRRKLESRGVETILYPLGTYRSGKKPLWEQLSFCIRSVLCGLRMAALVRKRGIGLIYVNGPRCLPAGVLASQIGGCPAIFHLHLTLTRWRELALISALSRSVAAILICSHASAQPLIDASPQLAGKIHVIYNPAPPRQNSLRGSHESEGESYSVTFGMIARVTEAKGQHALLEVIGALRPTYRDRARLIFLGAPAPDSRGDAAYLIRLKKRASTLGLKDKILWAGFQSNPGPYLEQMDALLVASSSQLGEALPMVILEALQRGVPVIAARTGGTPEIIRDGWNGLLVSPDNVDDLAAKIEQFLTDGALRQRLSLGARAGLDDHFSSGHFKAAVRRLINTVYSSPEIEHVQTAPGESATWK